jgi:gliding motility-associated-like protein
MWQNQNKIQNPASYAYDGNSGNSTIYVKVSQVGYCPDFYTINVVLKTTPMIEIPDYYYCKNDMVGIEIRPNFTGLNVVYYKWEYPDRSISEGANKDFISGVKQVGTYKLTLTNSLNCDYTATFKVINIDTPEITALRGQNDYYDVIATGIAGRKILYSMDMINWQESNRFGNLKPGDYTFYVRYSDSDCRGDMRMGRIFSIINTLTPNGDGINDYWKLSGLDVFPESSTLQIFDKFGNLVYKQISNTEFIWDGKFNGRNVTTDAYWYLINAADGRIYNGWILLKNRN